MTTFKILPPFGAIVTLGQRSVALPTEAAVQHIREDEVDWYRWCYLCPKTDDIITVATRPGQKFYVVDDYAEARFRQRWVCRVQLVLSAWPHDALTLGRESYFAITLPGTKRTEKDECTIEEVEIVGQGQQ